MSRQTSILGPSAIRYSGLDAQLTKGSVMCLLFIKTPVGRRILIQTV